MRDSIYTIPVNEIFEDNCGCPICNMVATLEERTLEYIMGAAMMEPDVRIQTNEQGFCKEHFDKMLKRKNRLSLALMLESHLKEIEENKVVKPKKSQGLFKKKETNEDVDNTCFVCNKIEWAIERMFDTIIKMYSKSDEFKKLYKEQPYICYPHFKKISKYACENMDKKSYDSFINDTIKLCKNYLDEVSADVSHYCKMFDYRNSGENADWGNSKDSIERAIYFLTSKSCE